MATRRVALVWASFSVAAVLYGMALAQGQQPKGPSIPTDYCSPVNTADMVPFNSDYQSDGRCYGNCSDLSYAFAVLQGKNCWCSNILPNRADQKDLRGCQIPCPGYPWDYCGGDGLYGYLEIGGFLPTGTAPPGGTSSTKAPATSRGSTVQLVVTVTRLEPRPSSPSTSSSTSTSSPSSSLTSTAASTTATDDSSKTPSVTTITVGGTVRTVTATPDPTASSDSSSDPAQVEDKSSGIQAGAIAGIVVGVVGGLAVIGGLIWLWMSKRRGEEDANNGLGSPIRGGSSPGTMATPKMTDITTAAPVGGAWDSQNKRRSHLMPVDPRLDPFVTGIYPADQNGSRESFNSLQDNQDYSRRVHQPPRVLRAVNPDPDDD